jgi:type I restriction enzyme S subunit
MILPKNWVSSEFIDVIEKISVLNENKIKQKDYLTEGKYPVIDQGEAFIGGYSNDNKKVINSKTPAIVFGDHTRCVKYVPFDFCAGADGIKVFGQNGCYEPKLFYYFIQVLTKKIPNKGYARHYQHLEKEYIPLPPLPEQHRIVAKIEALFSELDNGVDLLKTIKTQLAVYRQAVLKWAFEGKLTEEWRKENNVDIPIIIRKAPDYLTVDLKQIPNKWSYVLLNELGDLGRGKSKHRPRNDPKLFVNGKYPFIQTGDVKAAKKTISTFTVQYGEFGLKQSKLWKKGTLCITIAANIAETAFLDIEACFPDSIVGFTADQNIVEAKYVDFFIQSAKLKLSAFAPATAQKNINLETLENLIIPYCPKPEQQAIVSAIESRLSECDKLEKTIDDTLALSASLRQSILKKAFEGRLVPQDPNDEPAEKLLERIKAEKAAMLARQKQAKKSGKNHRKKIKNRKNNT